VRSPNPEFEKIRCAVRGVAQRRDPFAGGQPVKLVLTCQTFRAASFAQLGFLPQ
jgi:hypothetical protein